MAEVLFGIALRGDYLTLDPRLPSHWPEAEMDAVFAGTTLHIHISRELPPGLSVDANPATRVPRDGGKHTVRLGIPVG